jgi:hypothetical protein
MRRAAIGMLAAAWASSAWAEPGLFRLPSSADAAPMASPAWNVPRWADPARRAKFDGEEVRCSAQSAGGKFGVAGVYVWRIDLAGGVRRRYGARAHVYDLRTRRQLRVLTVRELTYNMGGRSVAPVACAITADESMLVVVSADRLALYALANGYLIDEQPLALKGDRVSLQLQGGASPMVRVMAGATATDFALER